MALCADDISALQERFGLQAITLLEDQPTVDIDYPVIEFPTKVKAHNFDKTPKLKAD